MRKKVFFRPKVGSLADVIPFSDGEKLYLYYLHDYKNKEKYGEGTPWNLLNTTDFINFEEHENILPRGNAKEQDLYVFTGSAIKVENKFHIFYTGHNPHFEGKKAVQKVMHAVSDDGIKYTKIKEDTFGALEGYEIDDWRDPFVFYSKEDKDYKMLLAARKQGCKKLGGDTLMLKSKDLKNWEYDSDFYFSDFYFTHECPDFFKLGKYYYLFFSEFNVDRVTRYLYSTSMRGPWKRLKDDRIDGRAYYAAKTTEYKGKRYSFGWVPSKHENDDLAGNWEWGGSLVCHELYNDKTGRLYQRPVENVEKLFSEVLVKEIKQVEGERIEVIDKTPKNYKLSLDFITDKEGEVDIVTNFSDKDSRGFGYKITNTGIEFKMIPALEWKFANFVGCERYVQLDMGKKHHIDLFVEGEVFTLYLDKKYALSTRVCKLNQKAIKLFSLGHKTKYTNVVLTTYKED